MKTLGPKALAVAIGCLAVAGLAAGCSSGGGGSAADQGASVSKSRPLHRDPGGMAPGPVAGTARRARLPVCYGPYLGVRCGQANSVRCGRVGIDVVLKHKAHSVSATLGDRTITLHTPGLHNGVRGEDWVGSLERAGMTRRGSAFFIPVAGRKEDFWTGDPPVRVRVRLTATYASGEREALFRRVWLSPGWG